MTEKLTDERLAYLVKAHDDPDNWGYSKDTAEALRELQSRRSLDAGRREALEAGRDALIHLCRRGSSGMPLSDSDAAALAHAATLRQMAGER